MAKDITKQLKVTKIEIVKDACTDIVCLFTALPSPYGSEGKLVMRFDAVRGQGLAYCKKHFPGVKVKETSL